MDRPFREVHELYKILYERAEAQQKAEEERRKKEEEEQRREQQRNKGLPANRKLADVPPPSTPSCEPSPMEAEAIEDMLEEIT